MIDTIFYFVPTYEEYKSKWDSNLLAARTIVFVGDQHAIYKGGVRYGGMSESDAQSVIDTIEPYDDTQIRSLITELNAALEAANAAATTLKNRLDALIAGLDDDIRDEVEDLFGDATWWQQHYPEEEVTPVEWHWDDNVQRYLQLVGYWTTDSHGNTITRWSELSQGLSDLQSTVAVLQASSGDTTALQSQLRQYIDQQIGSANTDINNLYVNKSDLGSIFDWMFSGFKSSASESYSFADVLAVAKNESGHKAISNLHTAIQSVGDNRYVAQSSLTSAVDNAISGIANDVSNTYASTTLFSKIDSNSNDIAAVVTRITGDSSNASVATKLGNWSAGFVTQADLNNATAGMIVQSDLEGYVQKAGVITAINESGSSVKISADKIELVGDTYVSNLIAQTITSPDGTVSANVEYLLEQINNKPFYTIMWHDYPVSMTISGGDLIPNSPGEDGLVFRGKTYRCNNVPGQLSLKVVMNGEDITKSCVSNAGDFDYFGNLKSQYIQIREVVGDVDIYCTKKNTVAGDVFSPSTIVLHPGETGTATRYVNNGSYGGVWQSSDTSIATITTATDVYNNLTITVTAGSTTGTATISATGAHDANSGSYTPPVLTVIVVPQGTPIMESISLLPHYDVTVGSTITLSPEVVWKDNVEGTASFSYEAIHQINDDAQTISGFISVNQNGVVTGNLKGSGDYVKVTASYTYDSSQTVSITSNSYIYVNDTLLSNYDSSSVYADIFGNRGNGNQLIVKGTGNQRVVVRPTYDGPDASLDDILVYQIGNKAQDSRFAAENLSVRAVGNTDSSWVSAQIEEIDNCTCLLINVDRFDDAINFYKNAAEDGRVPVTAYNSLRHGNDNIEYARVCTLRVSAADGSYVDILVIQDAIYGFYKELIGMDSISAYYLRTPYAWSSVKWYGAPGEEFEKSSMYQDSIKTPENGYYCLAKSNITGMPDSILGTYDASFVEKNPK